MMGFLTNMFQYTDLDMEAAGYCLFDGIGSYARTLLIYAL